MAEAMIEASADVGAIDLHKLGAPALRAIVRVLRKQRRLGRPLSGADVSLLKAGDAISLVEESRATGKTDDATILGLIKWASAKVGRASAETVEAEATDDDAAEAAPIVPRPAPSGDTLADAIAAALQGRLTVESKGVDPEAVKAIVAEALRPMEAQIATLAARPPLAIVVKTESAERKIDGRTHKQFPTLVKVLGAGCAPMLVGPAGSGKTQACHQAAEALGLEFRFTSVCSQTTASALLGYLDATGTYRGTALRHCYQRGGVFLLDEIDNGNPNVLAVLNAALANDSCEFPDGKIDRHSMFRLAAAGNTWGNGRTTEYVGRNPIDAATLDRFIQIRWGYDETLERDVSGNETWARYVQAFRAEIVKRGTRHMVTPRASIYGARLLAAGLPVSDVIDTVLTRGLDEATGSAVISAIGGAFRAGR